jgi:DNA-binding transcriptional LysR family regulator
MMAWDDLRFFTELARRGSLSEAARRLGADHSTVARRVTSLERTLGLKLFDRLPRGWALTVEGEGLAVRAEAVEAAIFALQRQADAGGAIEGRVRVSAPPALASLWLTPRLAPLRRRHPGLVVELSGTKGAASLIRREADLAVRLSRPTEGDLVARKLGDLRFGLYGARAYLDGTPKADRAIIAYDRDMDGAPQQRWLRKMAEGRPVALLTNDLVAMMSGVRAGMGLGALPHILVEEDGDLVCVADGPEATREIWLLLHDDLRRSARVRVVMDHLVAITEPLR